MYLKPMKRHRILELGQVTLTTLVGVLVLFFALLLDDAIVSYRQYYASLSVLFLGHGSLTLLGRMIIDANGQEDPQRSMELPHLGDWRK